MAVPSSPFRADIRPRSDPSSRSVVPGSTFEIVEIKPPNRVCFYIRVRASGALFLVVPARCPAQPRLWSFWVHRCRVGAVDPSEAPWVDSERLRREDLVAAARTIHDDADGWLKGKERAALRRWMLGDEGGC